MVEKIPESSVSSGAAVEGSPPISILPEVSGSSVEPETPLQSGSTGTRPRQVTGHYPVRRLTYYQISTSDIRSIGAAQAAATIFAAIGTFALSAYLEFGKDIQLAKAGNQTPPDFLENVAEFAFWAWAISWAVAVLAFLWQGNELRRIKREHGEPGFGEKIWAWLRKRSR